MYMKLFKNKKQLISLFILVTIAVSFFYPIIVVNAKTVEEIQQEIALQQAELEKLNAQMAELNKTLQENKAIQGSYNSEISKVRSIIVGYESQIALLELQSKQITEQINLATLQKEETEKRQDIETVDSYISWKTKKSSINLDSDIVRQVIYFEASQNAVKGQILGLSKQIEKLTNDKAGFEQQKIDVAKEMTVYEAQKALLEKQVAEYNNAVAAANKSMGSMRASAKGVTQNIDQLTKEQQDLMNADNQNTGDGTGGTEVIPTGQFYFSGMGRDLYQGHGVGLSQWGAYGIAKDHGWSYDRILKFYYTGVTVEARGAENINVNGYGTMTMENYVSGLGEIPDRACGTSQQILTWSQYSDNNEWASNDPRRNKYVLDNPNTKWDCWPEESIKAQVVAARSYAWWSRGGICTTAACQVYKGGQAKAWAAYETRNQYIIYGGSPIRAYYSSDNNQGHGTANNDTVFSGYDGIGWPLPYTRAVNDDAVAGTYGDWTHWPWRTNGYSISDINAMFNYEVAHYNVGGSAGNYIKGIKAKVGTITSLSITRDPSNRVRWVTLNGTNGSGNIQGLLFKYIWNDWVSATHSADKKDYIYSITFAFQQN